MRNIRLSIEYEGTEYSGWQLQRNQKPVHRNQKKTIQEILERSLSKILQEKIKLTGSGRTDAGVHALGQVANFKIGSKPGGKDIPRALNSILPDDIKITQAKQVQPDFHARFMAKAKVYRYTIFNHFFISPFSRRFCHHVSSILDVAKMQQASRYLVGRHNFRSFQSADKKSRSSVRTINRLRIHQEKPFIYLDIEADGFLYRMVRNIAGTLIEIGRGRIEPEKIQSILQLKNRIYAGPCAPAKGLCLMRVKY